MRALGARSFTPAGDSGSGMVKIAEAFARKYGAFARQFEKPGQSRLPPRTTGARSCRTSPAGARPVRHRQGTGGTLTGRARAASACAPRGADRTPSRPVRPVRRRGVEAATSSGWTPTSRVVLNRATSPSASCRWTTLAARYRARWRSRRYLCGLSSSGHAFIAALEVAKHHCPTGRRDLAMLPDTGECHQQRSQFEGINEGLTRSTAGWPEAWSGRGLCRCRAGAVG